MKSCGSIEEVRANIDRLDRQIVALLCERHLYVNKAAAFKKDADAVKAPQRVEQLIAKIRTTAAEHGGDPDIMEQIYRGIVSAFIEHELRLHREMTNEKGTQSVPD
ncbi:isochorismate pyruvate lyase [Paenibacillus sophorae]|uniref:Chorismate mutase n=1 Tax=Paenibacillus sophorae TaxID=1333845 RepID=A0A1H8HYU5_9BACL|nr:chorismate mutase [Paenibacillus sophorae]QWU15799.1 chorismate mutase [Paenibacillus sophorae]SEN61393.1 isochorismate pyruvate lyase [Paenibacillus sophorae]